MVTSLCRGFCFAGFSQGFGLEMVGEIVSVAENHHKTTQKSKIEL